MHDRVFCQPITERSLEALYESPCAKTLEILGLRTRNHVLILDGLCVLGDRVSRTGRNPGGEMGPGEGGERMDACTLPFNCSAYLPFFPIGGTTPTITHTG